MAILRGRSEHEEPGVPGAWRCSAADTHEVRKGEGDHWGPDRPAPPAARTTDRPRRFPKGAVRRGGVEEPGGDPRRGPDVGPGTADAPSRPPAEGPDPRSGETTGTPLAQQRRRRTEGSYAQRRGAGRAGKRDAPGRAPRDRQTNGQRGAPTAEAVGRAPPRGAPGQLETTRTQSASGPAPGSQRLRSQHRVGGAPAAPRMSAPGRSRGPRPRAPTRSAAGAREEALPPHPRAPLATRQAQLPASGPEGPPPGDASSREAWDDTHGPGQRRGRGRAPVRGGGTAGSEGRGTGPRGSDTAGPARQQARAPPPHAGALPGRRPPPEPPRPGLAARPACPAPPRAAEGPGHRPRQIGPH
ncbi:basic proline-rich protein-like [Bubalus kerabau]|uniref:basic proline-rich protein-like n=1 Tax=Bubalus carabanensis TaxID=3119969 RepID=UPI00244E69B6|nr:basic proline-rich protein-like [Bubalus carabanensis]